jgi:hypothetical protein
MACHEKCCVRKGLPALRTSSVRHNVLSWDKIEFRPCCDSWYVMSVFLCYSPTSHAAADYLDRTPAAGFGERLIMSKTGTDLTAITRDLLVYDDAYGKLREWRRPMMVLIEQHSRRAARQNRVVCARFNERYERILWSLAAVCHHASSAAPAVRTFDGCIARRCKVSKPQHIT